MKIVADENMPLVESIFSEIGEVHRVPGRNLRAEALTDADLLLVRSVTRVDAALLSQAQQLKFVGTATIGIDHVDTSYLAQRGIAFSSAPGCNADAVVEYVLSALFHIARAQGFDPASRRFGIVGVGNVGGRLAARLRALGYKVLLNDPPRQASGEAGFVDIDRLLAECDVVCLHTPLTRSGEWPTHHLLNEERLSALKQGTLLINAGRGPVIDNRALLKVKAGRADLTLVLDVWEHEPVVDPALAALTEIATPHIAGYSHDGKIRGTYMLYEACCRHLGLACEHPLADYLPPPALPAVEVTEAVQALDLIRLRYDPYVDDRALRHTLALAPAARGEAFDRLRKQYPQRREFGSLRIDGALLPEPRRAFSALGFEVAGGDEIA